MHEVHKMGMSGRVNFFRVNEAWKPATFPIRAPPVPLLECFPSVVFVLDSGVVLEFLQVEEHWRAGKEGLWSFFPVLPSVLRHWSLFPLHCAISTSLFNEHTQFCFGPRKGPLHFIWNALRSRLPAAFWKPILCFKTNNWNLLQRKREKLLIRWSEYLELFHAIDI